MILRIVTNTTMIQMARADKRRRSYRLGDSVQVIILPMKARIFFHSLLPIALMLSGCEQPETTQKIAALEELVKAFEKWPKDSEAWKKSLSHAEESYTDDLSPGTWTSVEAVLPEAKAEDITYIEVGIETDRISLTKQ